MMNIYIYTRAVFHPRGGGVHSRYFVREIMYGTFHVRATRVVYMKKNVSKARTVIEKMRGGLGRYSR